MDAKNQQDRAKMVEEAVGRMCRLGMMPQVITKFRKQGTVLKSETAGILYDLNDEEKKAVADWEEKSGGIVYAAILSNMVLGRCLALLYVSAEEEEWELDREDLDGRVPLAYVANLDAPDCSELGSIGIAPANGGLVSRVGGGVVLEYNEQTENLMEIAMMLEQLKGESEYLFEVLTDIDSITWKQKFVDWANEFTETYEPNKDVWPGNYLEVIEGFAREKILEFAGVEDKE